MPTTVKQLKDKGTGTPFVPVTAWEAVTNKPALVLKSDLPTVEIIDNTVLSLELSPNTIYIFINRTNNLNITLATPVQDELPLYHFIIESGDSAPTITFPVSLEWPGGDPEIDIDLRLEVNILDNNALYILS